ncbi:MAG TPA: hypothetical protein PKL31_08575 [Fulvivirga sp.]|nr:hypothetical protein [Fulvivirga sp.]
MEVEIFTLSDYAENFNGKLVIMGTFDSIFGSITPIKHPVCALSLRLRFAKSEIGQHTMRIKLINPNQKVLQTIDAQLQVNEPNSGVDYTSINTVLRFGNLEFDSFGKYSFELYIDDEWSRGLPLNFVKTARQLKAA